MSNKIINFLNLVGLTWFIPIVKLVSGESPKETVRELWFVMGVPIVAFLVFLALWGWSAQQIKTKALTRLVQNNRNRVEKELASILLSVIEKFDLETVDLCPMDALLSLNKTRVKTDLTQLRKLLKMDWKLSNQKNSNKYQKFMVWTDGDMTLVDTKGRYFTVEKEFLTKNFDDMMTDS